MTAADRRGYARVLACFAPPHGAKMRLATYLGVTRFVVDRWERYGIPRKYDADLVKLTGLRPDQIWG